VIICEAKAMPSYGKESGQEVREGIEGGIRERLFPLSVKQLGDVSSDVNIISY
jgi:hypothetical protein